MYHQINSITRRVANNLCKVGSFLEGLLARSCLICAIDLDSQPTGAKPTETQSDSVELGSSIPIIQNTSNDRPTDLIPDPLFPSSHLLCERCRPKLSTRAGVTLPLRGSYALSGISDLKSIWKMESEVDVLIKTLKYRSVTPLAGLFAHSLANYLANDLKNSGANPSSANVNSSELHMHKNSTYIPMPARWDYIVPIPSSPADERKRHFSHTALIAIELSKIIHVPCSVTQLRSWKTATRQAQTPLVNRHKNVAGRFHVNSQVFLAKSILLLDDTTTTGETLSAAASVLLNAGATRISALTIARSPRFLSNMSKMKTSKFFLET